jgi:hypothetical protein
MSIREVEEEEAAAAAEEEMIRDFEHMRPSCAALSELELVDVDS